MLSSKVLGNVTKRKSFIPNEKNQNFLSNLMLIAYNEHTNVDTLNVSISEKHVYDMGDVNCTYTGILGSSKTQM